MPETTGAVNWRVERYRDGDELAVLELFRTVFGKARSLEHWTWQFKSNPYGGPFVSVARREGDGAVVGSYSVMPIMLNVMGRAMPACQSVDTAVHPDHRGQRMFERTAADCYAWCREQGLQAVIGFPNASSYPGFVRTLGWQRILFPTKHLLRLRVRTAVRRMIGLPLLPEVVDGVYRLVRRATLGPRLAALRRLAGERAVFGTSDRVPQGYEALWNACRSYEVLSVWKDAAYMAWRYDRNPDQRFTYFHLSRGDDLVALAVGTDVDGTLALCDVLVAGRDLAAGRLLMAEISHHADRAGHRAVSFLGHDAGFFEDVLVGFEHQRSYGDVFGGLALADGVVADHLPRAGDWTVTFGDGDFV